MTAIRLSQCGQCARSLAFGAAGFERPPFTPEALARMELGHAFEARVILALQEEGWRVTDRQTAVLWADVLGHIDGIAYRPDGACYLLEVKSMGANSWRDFNANGLRFAKSHWLRAYYSQVQAYAAGLGAVGVALDGIRIEIAYRDDKATDPLVSFERAHETLAIDEDHAALVSERLLSVLTWLSEPREEGVTPPVRLREYARREDGTVGQACGYCDYSTPCWGGLEKSGRAWFPKDDLVF